MKKYRILGVIVLLLYLVGVGLFSYFYYPKTYINGKNVGFRTERDVLKEEEQKINEDTFTLTSDQWEYNKKIYNSEYAYLQFVDNGKCGEIRKKQKPYLWFIKMWGEKKYTVSFSEIDKKSIENLSKDLIAENPEKIEEPKSANLTYNESTKQYDIKPESYGNQLMKEEVKKILEMELKKDVKEIDLSSCYEKPEILKDSKKLLKMQKKLNKYLKTEVQFKAGKKQVVLDADTIHYFLCWDKNLDSWISTSAVEEYIREEIVPKYNTVGKKRTIKTKSKGKTTVSGGTFGWIVNVSKETEQITEEIKKGEKIKRKPIFSQEAVSHSENDIGNTFIEISISDQYVWYVKDGKTVISAPCVTGNVSTHHNTPTGVYFIEYKVRDYTMRKYNAHVNYWMPFDTGTGVGLHDADWRNSFGGSIYRYNGSHGCVNLPPWFARELYSAPVNTPVLVVS